MNEREAHFVESMAALLYARGLPRIAGRIWAWLLICDPPQRTAADLADTLHASRGSISSAVRLLENPGLIRRTTRAGDRREYFSVPPGSVVAVLQSSLPATVAWRKLAQEGLEMLADDRPERRERLQELYDVYAFMERELPALVDRFMAERRGSVA